MYMQRCCASFYISWFSSWELLKDRSSIPSGWALSMLVNRWRFFWILASEALNDKQHVIMQKTPPQALHLFCSLPSSPSFVSHHCLLLQFYLIPFVFSLLFSFIFAVCYFLKQLLSHFSINEWKCTSIKIYKYTYNSNIQSQIFYILNIKYQVKYLSKAFLNYCFKHTSVIKKMNETDPILSCYCHLLAL